MHSPPEHIATADAALLDLLRKQPLGVAELGEALGVTATAVRQRLNRLMAQGYVDRVPVRSGRGRPSHHYELTSKGQRHAGANFADLAMALWQEVRAIEDESVRRGLLQRLSQRLVAMYAGQVEGRSMEERMESVARLFADRRVPFQVEQVEGLPVLTALACPYPELAEMDRSVCAMEKIMLGQLLGGPVRLSRCRLDGETCCTFETSAVGTG